MLAPPPTKSKKQKPQKLITGKEFAAMTEIGRAELVNGRIIEMPPPQNAHGRCEGNFYFFVSTHVRKHKTGKVFVGESGVYVRRAPDTVRGMDVAYISNERWAKQRDPDGYLEIAPDLIVEVLSPSDSWNAVMTKLREYFAIGVRLVWVADTAAHIVYAYRSPTDVREFNEGEDLSGDEVLPGFSVPVRELFAD